MPENYTYHYPNQRSYNQLPVSKQHDDFHWQGRSLRHGYIMGYKETGGQMAEEGGPATGDWLRDIFPRRRQVDTNLYKMFQFNPSALNIVLSMMQTDSADVELEGGNNPNVGVGYASTALELFFDRTWEIARSNKGHGHEKWRDLGVQWDMFDLLKVISGGDLSWLAETSDSPTAQDVPGGGSSPVVPGSTNHLSGMLLDAAVSGAQLMMKPFIIVFNPNLSVHVLQMSSFAFSYIRFTTDLVPTTVQVNMNLVISNMGSKSYTTSGQAPTQSGTSSAPPGTNDLPDWQKSLWVPV